jgi:hypothetical protein
MSVSVVAMEHALRLIADENKVFYVYSHTSTSKTTKKIKLPYNGTVKFTMNLSALSGHTEISAALYDSNGEKICEKYDTVNSTIKNKTISINANVSKDLSYYVVLGEHTLFENYKDGLTVCADVIYGSQLGEIVD